MKTTDFHVGMTINSCDGVPLGRITEIWAQTASHGLLPISQYLLQDFGPVRGTTGLLTSSEGYLHVQPGNRFTADRRDLYLPLADIGSIDSQDSATVKLSARACYEQCGGLPYAVKLAA